MPVMEQSSQLQVSSVPPQYSEQKQRRRMLIALVLLVCALALVLYRDRDLLFPSAPDADSEIQTQTSPETTAVSRPATTIVRQPVSSRAKAKQQQGTAPANAGASASGGPAITATRAVLPPLEIEVVAGDQRQTVQATNPSIRVDLQARNSGQSSSPARNAPSGVEVSRGTVNASAQVRLSPGAAQVVSHPVQPDYPLLARQMKVQGSVILQALIGKEGTIQELQVLSGPAILSVAAREAVKQWHFKPYLQSGLPVETEAKITVNFTISTN